MEKIKHLSCLCLIIGLIGLVSCRPSKGPVIINGLDTDLIVKTVYEDGHTIPGLLPSGRVLWAGYINARLVSLILSRPDGEILFEAGTDQPSLLKQMNEQHPPFVLFVEDAGVRRISYKEFSEYNDEKYKEKRKK